MRLAGTLCSALTGAVLFSTFLSAQGRTDLPPPDSSRAPLLTRAPADSIRYQTAYLHAAELLQALQAGNATTMGVLLAQAPQSSSTCSWSEAVSKAATRVRRIVRSGGGTSLALFFDKIQISDSGRAQVVTAELVLLLAVSSVRTRSSVTLIMDSDRAVWTNETGILSALCNL